MNLFFLFLLVLVQEFLAEMMCTVGLIGIKQESALMVDVLASRFL